MKKSIVFIFTVFLLGSCAIFTPRQEFQQGMTERKFLRQNKDAVMSSMDGPFITYRVNRGERFYILATFENKELVKIEEREISPAWMPAQPSENEE